MCENKRTWKDVVLAKCSRGVHEMISMNKVLDSLLK
jgi:hypothetical protein